MISFNNIAIGVRFFYDGAEYIKTYNPQNDEVGAVHICTGTYKVDCANWIGEIPIKPTKEKKTEQDDEIAIFTYVFDDNPATDPTMIRITKEQKRIIEILYDYDILCPDINVNFKSDTLIIDATKE